MAKLCLMIGCPGSGKTTYVKSILKENDLYLSRDEIRFSLLKEGDAYFSKEKEVFQTLIKKINEGLEDKTIDTIYVDATHLNGGSRSKVLNKLTTKPDSLEGIYIDISLDQALKNNAKRTGRAFVPEESIMQMYYSIDLPTRLEKFNKLTIVQNKCIIEERYFYYN